MSFAKSCRYYGRIAKKPAAIIVDLFRHFISFQLHSKRAISTLKALANSSPGFALKPWVQEMPLKDSPQL
jgi:hypothetical protein